MTLPAHVTLGSLPAGTAFGSTYDDGYYVNLDQSALSDDAQFVWTDKSAELTREFSLFVRTAPAGAAASISLERHCTCDSYGIATSTMSSQRSLPLRFAMRRRV
jgi:hypothetical protein